MLRPALVLLLGFTLLLGGAYPAAVTVAARVLFPREAAGSVVRDARGEAVGSALVGQPFSAPRYFWGRPSATGAVPCDGRASGGSNQGPSSPALADAVRARIARLRASDPGNAAAIPVDLVTASGSGLDPHVSPAAALWQVGRVARARGLPEHRVRALVEAHVEQPFLGLFGAPRVNVLALNVALDAVPR
jgi:K+-transporting ATPase ATPase C chain